MANFGKVKVLVGLVFLVASLWGLKEAGERGHLGKWKSPHLRRILRLFGMGRGGTTSAKYEPSKCRACLAEGSDFCISGNKCIPRATFQCDGPHDHITGDEEFAEHGNPKGIPHSMVCPEKKKNSEDCYFDKDCHAKVDWVSIDKIKGGFYARLKVAKEKQNPSAAKEMMGKVHKMFGEAGMPEDRIDDILVKWVKQEYPEALDKPAAEDKLSLTMCVIAKERCMKDGEKVLTGRCGVQWNACERQREEPQAKEGSESEAAGAGKATEKRTEGKGADVKTSVRWQRIWRIKDGLLARLGALKDGLLARSEAAVDKHEATPITI